MRIEKTASGKSLLTLTKKEWLTLGKKAGWSKIAQFGNMESLSLGPTPAGEGCAQVGTDDYYKWSKIETRAYANQIKRLFPSFPAGVSLRMSSNPHEFGTYHELDIVYNMREMQVDDNDASMDFIYDVENGIPEYWDELAKEELQEQGYQYL